MQKFKSYYISFRKSYFLNLFSYALISSLTLVFPPYNITFLSWLAPFGLFLLVEKYKLNYKKLFYNGVFAGIIFQLIAFNWLIELCMTFGKMNYIFAFITTIFAGAFLNLKFSLFLILFAYVSYKLPHFKVILAGLSILITEIFSIQIFPWYFGYMISHVEILAQTAEFFSVYGLSFLLFCISYSLFRIIKFPFIYKKPKILLKLIYIPSIFLIFFTLLGFTLKKKWESVEIVKTKNVLLLQPDPPLAFRDRKTFDNEMDELIVSIRNLANQAKTKEKIDIVFLGESSIPFFSANHTEDNLESGIYWDKFDNVIKDIIKQYKSNFFFNEINSVFSKEKNLRYFNNTTLYDKNGKRHKSYQKIKLLIFGEYMPFEFLYKIIPQTGRFTKGSSFNFIPYFKEKDNKLVEDGKILPLICYEIIFPEFLRNFKNIENVDFIANLTNDKWYGDSLEPYQHLELSRIRAIETRKPIVRVTNSGISAIIDHFGQIQSQTDILTKTVLKDMVKIPKKEKTFYVSFGNIPIYIFILFSFFIILFIEKKKVSV